MVIISLELSIGEGIQNVHVEFEEVEYWIKPENRTMDITVITIPTLNMRTR